MIVDDTLGQIPRRAGSGWSPLTIATMGIIGATQVLTNNSIAYFVAAIILLVVFSLKGNALVPLFIIGLSIMDSLTLFGPTPVPRLVVMMLTLISVASLRAIVTKSSITVDLPLGVASILLMIYFYAVTPESNAGVIAAFAMIMVPMTAFVLCWYLSTFAVCRNSLVTAFILGSAIAIGNGVFDAYTSVGENYDGYLAARIFESSIGSSNKAAAMSVAAGLMVLSLGWYGRYSKKMICLVLSAPFLAAPIVFASRGSLVALLGTAAIVILLTKFHTAKKLAVILVGLGCVLLVLSYSRTVEIPVVSRLTVGGDVEEFSSGRTIIWSYVLSRFWDKPLLGLGPGGIAEDLLSSGMAGYPHQFFLGLLVSIGLVGTTLYLYAIARQLRGGWNQLTPVVIYLILVSMLEPVVSTPGAAPLAGVLIALYGILGRGQNENCDGDRVLQRNERFEDSY